MDPDFLNLFFNWRIIALLNFVVFCQTPTWISHGYTRIPSLLNLRPVSRRIPALCSAQTLHGLLSVNRVRACWEPLCFPPSCPTGLTRCCSSWPHAEPGVFDSAGGRCPVWLVTDCSRMSCCLLPTAMKKGGEVRPQELTWWWMLARLSVWTLEEKCSLSETFNKVVLKWSGKAAWRMRSWRLRGAGCALEEREERSKHWVMGRGSGEAPAWKRGKGLGGQRPAGRKEGVCAPGCGLGEGTH